jgi:hypothetical protein
MLAGDGVRAENERGFYFVPMPQKTIAFAKQREKECSQIGDGWRVPSIEELFDAPVDLREKSEKSLYASSTRHPKSDGEIYYHSFENRDVNLLGENENLYLVCFKPKNQVQKHDITWGKSEQSRMDFKEAKSFCESKGMRLPTSQELFFIAMMKVFNEAEYNAKFGFTQPKYYWSLDANDDFSNTAIVVGFLRASVASSAKDNKSFVRCVKDAK